MKSRLWNHPSHMLMELVFVVEFESSVVLRENVTSVKEDETPNGVTYTFEEIVAVKPSGKLKPL